MIVCHIATGGLREGAARGALWLHQALVSIGEQSILVTNNADGAGKTPGVVETGWRVTRRVRCSAAWRRDQWPLSQYPRRQGHLFSVGTSGLSVDQLPCAAEADLIHLHWICGGFIDVRSLVRAAKPLVWTLRDLWPVTGGCHHPSVVGCTRFSGSCGQCPHLGSNVQEDLSAIQHRLKHANYPSHTCFIAPSRWVAEQAMASSLLDGRQLVVIPNCVDTQTFRPLGRLQARALLGLPPESHIVLTGAGNRADPYKGFDLFLQLIQRMPKDIVVATFGRLPPDVTPDPGRTWISFGTIKDGERLRAIYSAANVFVATSRVETFAKTIAEAQACGTPAVAFNHSGPRDIINHRSDGWLAIPYEVTDLAMGVSWVLDHAEPCDLSAAARLNAESRFSYAAVATQHRSLYSRLCGKPA